MTAGDDDDLGGGANQRLAADPKASVWVSANAGTGKTHVLIDRISRLLLTGAEPERLLCLTFTKAAAAEMANRLNKRLAEWARASDDELKTSLRRLTGSAQAPDDLTPARRLFAQVLEAPGGLKIRTIHSFCESLLGRFPLEAGVSPHFSVLDERTATELLEDARDRLLLRTQCPGGEDIAAALEALAGMVGEEGFAKLKKELAFRRGRFTKQQKRAGGIDALIDAVYADFDLASGETETAAIAAAVADGAYDAKGLRSAAAVLAGGKKTDKDRSAVMLPWLAMNAQDRAATFVTSYMKGFLTQKGEPCARLITKDPAAANPQAEQTLLVEQGRVAEVGKRLNAVRGAELTSALVRFGGALLAEYEALKNTRALLDYDDLILKAAELLASDDGVSWVHFKLDGGIDHILIDEAQDTSPEQWEVIRRLAGDFYSGLGVKEAGERTVFAVGDEKQSIYSFQGADPEGFRRMCAYFREKATNAGGVWREVPLIQSHRSTIDVLGAVDRVFAAAEAADGLRGEGEEIRHYAKRMGHAGLVEVWPVVKPMEEVIGGTAWDDPVDRVGADAPPVILADRIADAIRRWLNEGEELVSAGRPLRPDDIMILVRKRGTFADAMIRALKVRGVPVAGSDRMQLTKQLAVMDLLALGGFALMPEDDLTLAEVLKGPFIGFDDGALYDVAYQRSGSLWRALRDKADDESAYADAAAYLKDILKRADYAPPFEFFAHIMGAKGGRRAVLSRLGHEAADPIDEFMSLALDFERTHTPSLQGFLHWIAAGEIEVKRDLDVGRPEVRVLTVHGAKGLEANVVFLPDTFSVPDPRSENYILWGENAPLWPADKTTEPDVCRRLREAVRRVGRQEYRRLLYVAMTRARDRLYICGFAGAKQRESGPPQGCWYDMAYSAIKEAESAIEVPVIGFNEPGLRLISRQEADPKETAAGRRPIAEASAPPAWAGAPPPPEPTPLRPLAPSRPEGEEPAVSPPFGSDGGARFKRGRLIHRLLQSLPDLDPARRVDAARRYLARPIHGLDDEARVEIADKVSAVLAHPEFAPIFGPGSRAEAAVSGEVAGHVISARVDRLLVTGEAVSVIDYKTNRRIPENENDVPVYYLRQMAAYRQALGLIYPDRPVRCLLLWTDGPRLMALSDPLLDRHSGAPCGGPAL